MTFYGWSSAVSHRRTLSVPVCVCVSDEEEREVLACSAVYILQLNVSVMTANVTAQLHLWKQSMYTHTARCVSRRAMEEGCTDGLLETGWKRHHGCVLVHCKVQNLHPATLWGCSCLLAAFHPQKQPFWALALLGVIDMLKTKMSAHWGVMVFRQILKDFCSH